MQPATVRRDPRRHRASTGRVAPDVEVTLEANPTSVEATRFRGYRAAGVNRVSLGVQALDDAALKELGRLHTAQEALDAVAVARAIFERYSFDLIYARPRQTPQAWAAELERAIARSGRASVALSVDHRAGHAVLRAARGRQARHARTKTLARASLRPDAGGLRRARACRPTRFPITRGPAPSAGTISSTGAGTNMPASAPARMAGSTSTAARHATATEKRPEAWLMRVEAIGHGLIVDEPLSRDETADEYLLMGLRLAEGIDPARYAALAGRPLDPRAHRDPARGRRGRDDGDGCLRVTPAGFPVLDAVVADLAA